MPISTVFLLLVIYAAGTAWATLVPSQSRVEGTRFAKLGPFIEFLNPRPFGMKEVRCTHCVRCTTLTMLQHIVATVIASTAARGSTAVQNFAVQRVSDDQAHSLLVLTSVKALLRYKGGCDYGRASNFQYCNIWVGSLSELMTDSC